MFSFLHSVTSNLFFFLEKDIYDLSGDKHALEEYLVAVPLELLEAEQDAASTKYGAEGVCKVHNTIELTNIMGSFYKFCELLQTYLTHKYRFVKYVTNDS